MTTTDRYMRPYACWWPWVCADEQHPKL